MIGAMPAELPVDVFRSEADASRWRPIDDAVMGGMSESRMSVTSERTGVFSGRVSAERNGGFASVRTQPKHLDLEGYEGLRIRVRGDGKRYKLGIRTDAAFDGVVYRRAFQPEAGDWRTIDLPFEGFVPTLRGRAVPGAGPLDPRLVMTLGLLISDRQLGPFRLEIASIMAYRGAGGAAR
jgi:NADH dehydrogenase [ubiquinone] 1 alpha subcomplex assembly factor 1